MLSNSMRARILSKTLASFLVMMVVLPIVMLLPILDERTENAMAIEAASEIEFEIPLALSVNVANKADLNFSPQADGQFNKNEVQVLVSTNNKSGYTLTLSNDDDDLNMNHMKSTITQKIVPLTGVKTESEFEVNAWGYSLDATNYQPTPKKSDAVNIRTVDQPINESSTKVSFGAKVDNSMPSGVYVDKVVFTAVANYVPSPTFGGITTMQEMTTEICDGETTPIPSATSPTLDHSTDKNLVPEAYLRDERDNKKYIVRKLADGKCWMTQNLDLSLYTDVPLSNKDTDLNSKNTWTPTYDTQELLLGTVWSLTGEARSYDPGADVYYVSGSPQYIQEVGSPVTHAGNLYNWYAGTAGEGSYAMNDGTEVEDSICPRGWKLPRGGNNDSMNDILKLANIYGVMNASADKLTRFPLSMNYSGYYGWSDGQHGEQGRRGLLMTNMAASGESIYTAIFDKDNVELVANNGRKGTGRAIRCVAR